MISGLWWNIAGPTGSSWDPEKRVQFPRIRLKEISLQNLALIWVYKVALMTSLSIKIFRVSTFPFHFLRLSFMHCLSLFIICYSPMPFNILRSSSGFDRSFLYIKSLFTISFNIKKMQTLYFTIFHVLTLFSVIIFLQTTFDFRNDNPKSGVWQRLKMTNFEKIFGTKAITPFLTNLTAYLF